MTKKNEFKRALKILVVSLLILVSHAWADDQTIITFAKNICVGPARSYQQCQPRTRPKAVNDYINSHPEPCSPSDLKRYEASFEFSFCDSFLEGSNREQRTKTDCYRQSNVYSREALGPANSSSVGTPAQLQKQRSDAQALIVALAAQTILPSAGQTNAECQVVQQQVSQSVAKPLQGNTSSGPINGGRVEANPANTK